MKQTVMLAAALTFMGSAAMATSWGSFGSYYDGYRSFHDFSYSYSREEKDDDYSSYFRLVSFVRENLEFCGCGDYWTKDCQQDDNGHHEDTPEVPLPAAGFLLLGALGGIASLKRNKK